MATMDVIGLSCPAPAAADHVTLAHGGGGRATRQLVDRLFRPVFDNGWLDQCHDGALLPAPVSADGRAQRLAFTTDGYVVHPLFFPGGDIGSLAVNGTVNDLAMCGARPHYLSAAFVLEEGLPLSDLARVVRSMRLAADAAGVALVTGDTKVVDRGHGDGLFVTTAGIGVMDHDRVIAPSEVRPGDAILLSGDLGRHGVAILAAREGLGLATTVSSDCAPLVAPVRALLDAGVAVHCLRDLTRGGLAAATVEIAELVGRRFELDETAVAVAPEVESACELLGLDPMLVACEGRFIAFVPEPDVARALDALAGAGCRPACIGRVAERSGPVVLRTALGTTRVVDLPSGEQLPRIC
jgi:hydrogenase expression/formation protein HypE